MSQIEPEKEQTKAKVSREKGNNKEQKSMKWKTENKENDKPKHYFFNDQKY